MIYIDIKYTFLKSLNYSEINLNFSVEKTKKLKSKIVYRIKLISLKSRDLNHNHKSHDTIIEKNNLNYFIFIYLFIYFIFILYFFTSIVHFFIFFSIPLDSQEVFPY